MIKAMRLRGSFSSNDRGNVAIIFAMMLVPAAILTGGTGDYGKALLQKERLQAAADAAALAAATPFSATDQQRITIATNLFAGNVSGTELKGVTPQITVSGHSVSVTATTNVPTPFLSIINIPYLPTVATATAVGNPTTENTNPGKICILALDPNSTDGIHLQGANQVNYADCWAHTNSSQATAINAVGNSSKAIGLGHCAVGGYTETGDTFTPLPTTGCTTVDDPFATVGAYDAGRSYAPTFTSPALAATCTASNLSLKKGVFTLNPGRYCGGINIQAGATVTLNAGVYYIDNGVFNVQSGSSVTGKNVMLYLGGANSSITLIGGGTVDLQGRWSGSSYQGFLVIQDPKSNSGGVSNIQGGGTFKMQGVIYMPTQTIEVSGNGDVNNANVSVFGMVAKNFYFRGNGVFNAKKFSGGNIPDIMPTMPVNQRQPTRLTN